jgi:filamentous hemagglutinin family protein
VRLRGWFTVLGTCMLEALAPRVGSAQHVTIDGRLSPAQTLVGPNYTIGANLGKQVGSNLFHSFGQFSLSHTPVPESASFTSTGSTGPISNVVGRVTGGNQSGIDGAIISAISGANLYLINPSGIVFGPHATVNILGSFHASTADYLKMSDGAKFQATNPDDSTLSAAPPVAFGFLTASPAQISVNGSSLGPVPGTLGLVGGPVSITSGTLSGPAGTIHVTAAAGTGEVPVDPRNTPALTVTSFGPVAVTGGSKLDVSNPSRLGSGGSVFIRSGALSIDASEINADNYGQTGGGQISLSADGGVTVQNGSFIRADAHSTGAGADIAIATGSGGNVAIGHSVLSTSAFQGGPAGNINVAAGGGVVITEGGFIDSSTFGPGNGGTVQVSAQGPLSLSGPGSGILTSANATGVLFRFLPGNPSRIIFSLGGSAGSVTVNGSQITIVNGAEIASTTAGTGAGGSVAVTTPGALMLGGGAQITASATGPQSGQGGSVTVAANSLTVEGGAQIASVTAGPGRGDDVDVAVVSDITLSGRGPQITAQSTGSGTAGSVLVLAGRLLLTNGAAISTEAETPTASGGNILLKVGDFLYLTNSEITTSIKGENGANIIIDAPIAILDHSAIIGQAINGHSGNVVIAATGAFLPSSDSIISGSQTGLFNANGPVVMQSTELRNAAAVQRDSCGALGGGRAQAWSAPVRSRSRKTRTRHSRRCIWEGATGPRSRWPCSSRAQLPAGCGSPLISRRPASKAHGQPSRNDSRLALAYSIRGASERSRHGADRASKAGGDRLSRARQGGVSGRRSCRGDAGLVGSDSAVPRRRSHGYRGGGPDPPRRSQPHVRPYAGGPRGPRRGVGQGRAERRCRTDRGEQRRARQSRVPLAAQRCCRAVVDPQPRSCSPYRQCRDRCSQRQ